MPLPSAHNEGDSIRRTHLGVHTEVHTIERALGGEAPPSSELRVVPKLAVVRVEHLDRVAPVREAFDLRALLWREVSRLSKRLVSARLAAGEIEVHVPAAEGSHAHQHSTNTA